MKTKILTSAVVLAAMLATSCNDNWTPPVGDDGQLDLSAINIVNDDAAKLIKNEQSRAAVDTNPYLVEIYKAGEDAPEKSWTVVTMPEVVSLPTGDYRIFVESHKVQKAEWEKPYYKGEQTFTIEAGKITQVETVTCKFASVKVTIKLTDDFRAIIGDDATFTVHVNDSGELVYGVNETRAGYFEAVEGSTTMVIDFKGTLNGKVFEKTFSDFVDIAAGQHREVTFAATEAPTPEQPSGDAEIGGINIDFSYSDKDIDGNISYEEENITGQRPGQETPKDPETPENPDDPTPPVTEEPITFTSATLDLENVNDAGKFDGSEGSAVVDIHADKGLKHLYVKIVSKILDESALEGIGLAASFDLAEPGALEEGIISLGFPYGEAVVDETDVKFDISTFLPMLSALGTGDDAVANHEFSVTAVDSEGNEKAFSLKFIVK